MKKKPKLEKLNFKISFEKEFYFKFNNNPNNYYSTYFFRFKFFSVIHHNLKVLH